MLWIYKRVLLEGVGPWVVCDLVSTGLVSPGLVMLNRMALEKLDLCSLTLCDSQLDVYSFALIQYIQDPLNRWQEED